MERCIHKWMNSRWMYRQADRDDLKTGLWLNGQMDGKMD